MSVTELAPTATDLVRRAAQELLELGNLRPEHVDPQVVAGIDEQVATHRENVGPLLNAARQQYSAEHYARLTGLIPDSLVAALRAEARVLADTNTRRIDITVPVTGNTPRKLSSIPNSHFTEHGPVFSALYSSPEFRNLLSDVVGTPILDATYEDEKFTGTQQNRVGDTHGWHWGDHEFAFIFIAEAPSIEHGGMLQSCPHTLWDKADPAVHQRLAEGTVRTYYHAAGESYIFKTDTSLHRTVPIQTDGVERIIINLTFASIRDWLEEKSYETTAAVYTD
ncbi:MAG TPA: hypothetical protein VH372_26835 [Actinospica sp.]|jgi:hypothetical protein|nr:hypothetical protein [Actinospica sp.]